MTAAWKARMPLAGIGLAVFVLIPREAAAQQPAEPATKPPEVLSIGGVLSGELLAIRSGSRKKRVVTYQLKSEPRRLPPPAGFCDLENGPETFQIVTKSDAEVAALKPYLGKSVAVRASEVACAQEKGEFSDAIVTKWSVVK